MRSEQKISREKLAEELDVSIQQIYKYETGKNRIAIEKLISLAKRFGVDLNYFADDIVCHEDKKVSELTTEEEDVIMIYRNIRNDKLREVWLTIGTELSKCVTDRER
ncbi:helix-turn-helix transcriptional regulator [Desulfococcaceae bacterium HSG8]|nr:helix-turn-helix transcriptional regulator [Desulfococcaceae bacterium HSG8]